jgi:hypothetical protein
LAEVNGQESTQTLTQEAIDSIDGQGYALVAQPVATSELYRELSSRKLQPTPALLLRLKDAWLTSERKVALLQARILRLEAANLADSPKGELEGDPWPPQSTAGLETKPTSEIREKNELTARVMVRSCLEASLGIAWHSFMSLKSALLKAIAFDALTKCAASLASMKLIGAHFYH